MLYVNFYRTKTKTNYVWSLTVGSRIFTFRLDQIAGHWRPKFITYKLENLDILGLYYEVGMIEIIKDKG